MTRNTSYLASSRSIKRALQTAPIDSVEIVMKEVNFSNSEIHVYVSKNKNDSTITTTVKNPLLQRHQQRLQACDIIADDVYPTAKYIEQAKRSAIATITATSTNNT